MAAAEDTARYRARHPLRAKGSDLYRAAKWRAKRDRLPFTITLPWIMRKLERMTCEVTGVHLRLALHPGRGSPGPYTPSLDQIRPGKGYTPGNTRLVAWGYNALKGRGHDAEAAQFIYEASKGLQS